VTSLLVTGLFQGVGPRDRRRHLHLAQWDPQSRAGQLRTSTDALISQHDSSNYSGSSTRDVTPSRSR
jgi:hypothetical protein